jgi:AcrR family transcriptional regulator
MSDSRSKLLAQVMDEAGANGLADRSLRDLATAVGSSHRMLLFHFGSRSGLVSAIVEAVESVQRDLLVDLADQVTNPSELVLALWRRVSSAEMQPFVRLFFECVALTGGEGLTDPWMDVADVVATKLGVQIDPTELRLGVAVTRGLLIDVLSTGDAGEATASIERFVEMWDL